MLRRRGGAVLGVRREGARGEQARGEARESHAPLRRSLAPRAQVRHMPGLLCSFFGPRDSYKDQLFDEI